MKQILGVTEGAFARADDDRRSFLGAALLGLLGASLARPSTVRGRAQSRRRPAPAGDAPNVENDDAVERLLPALTNWGRWGKADQLGTLNYITPGRSRGAAALVRSGRAVSLAREVSVTKTEGIRRGTYEMMRDEGGSRDFVGMIFHGFAQTHLDALCHAFTPDGKMYNGFSSDEVTPQGANRLGVERMAARGVAGRGVLLDVAALKGAALQPGAPVFISDLEAAERRQGVRVGAGDILLVRTGAGFNNTRERRAGLHPECLTWLHKRQVALLGGDGDNDVAPLAGFERFASAMHSVAIPFMGLPLLDNAELDALSRVCVEEERWQFLLTVAPWRFRGVTSSPVNPIALF
ncbi:MAG TPA: cyclase family protein [Pyrinomonadaceae bacterium]|jgi:kynurenine formamidase